MADAAQHELGGLLRAAGMGQISNMARKSFGSGRSAKSRPLVEHALALNVFVLRENGALLDGATTVWSWRSQKADEGDNALAVARMELGNLVITFNGSTFVIAVDWIANRQGNFPMWICPACGKRRHTLYVTARIVCRRCSGLEYLSRYTWNGAALRAVRLRKRLTSGRPIDRKRRERMLQLLTEAEQKAKGFLAASAASADHRIQGLHNG